MNSPTIGKEERAQLLRWSAGIDFSTSTALSREGIISLRIVSTQYNLSLGSQKGYLIAAELNEQMHRGGRFAIYIINQRGEIHYSARKPETEFNDGEITEFLRVSKSPIEYNELQEVVYNPYSAILRAIKSAQSAWQSPPNLGSKRQSLD